MLKFNKEVKMAGILNIQLKSLMSDKQTNLKKVEHYIKFNKEKPLDLVVLPEFFSTNIEYLKEPEDENGGETIKFIQNLAKEYNTNIIAGSVVRKVENKLYNTSYAINRMGEIIAKYDKIHLYNYLGGSEGKDISAGENIVIAHFDFAKVGLAICFDVRYPLHFNKLLKEGVQVITLPSAWLVPKMIYENEHDKKYAQETWLAMLRTRAYDNMVYLIASNQTKDVDGELFGIGYSSIISPTSQIMACAQDKECAIYSKIDIETVKYLRTIYPIDKID